MSGQQAGLCLSCGTPFCPKPTDEVSHERLGNMSLAYIQRQVRINRDAMTKIEHPAFYAVQEGAHVIHETHHRMAILIMAGDRKDTDMYNDDMSKNDGAFPFILAPKSKRKAIPLAAHWLKPSKESRIRMKRLLELCTNAKPTRREVDMNKNYSIVVGCCKSCNSTMTMEYWFRYHLFADYTGPESNPDRIMTEDNIMEIYEVDTNKHENIEDYMHWNSERKKYGEFPSQETPRNKEMMAPAVAYYLNLCLPFGQRHYIHKDGYILNKHLYLEMCWVALEITCLMCEYWRGSGDKENKQGSSKKRNQSHKSPLGAIELYYGYFCWCVFFLIICDFK